MYSIILFVYFFCTFSRKTLLLERLTEFLLDPLHSSSATFFFNNGFTLFSRSAAKQNQLYASVNIFKARELKFENTNHRVIIILLDTQFKKENERFGLELCVADGKDGRSGEQVLIFYVFNFDPFYKKKQS